VNDVRHGLVDSLRADGIAVAPITQLFDEETWAHLRTDVASFVRETKEWVRTAGDELQQKKYLVRRFWSKKQAAMHRFPLDDPWLRLFASKTMLDVVNAYRGEWTKLYYLDIWFTVPFVDSTERLASQRWHRDPEDQHVVKAFLYLVDVDEGTGPFEYVCGSTRGGRYGDLWPWETGEFYPPQADFEQAIAPEDRLSVTAPAGTLVFADTGGFHRGGYSRTTPRILATCTYVPPSSMKERRFEVELDGGGPEVPVEVRFALDLRP
jgi:hypothetical protein